MRSAPRGGQKISRDGIDNQFNVVVSNNSVRVLFRSSQASMDAVM